MPDSIENVPRAASSSGDSVRILKANAARNLGAKVAFNYEDLRRHCDEYLERAREQAQQMIADARAEAEKIKQQTYQQALADGRRDGLEQAEEQIRQQATKMGDQRAAEKLKTTLPALQKAANALIQQRDQWVAEWETTAIRLSVAIAEKILRTELAVQPDRVQQMLSETLQLVTGGSKIQLNLHPDDLELLGEAAEDLIRGLSGCGEVALEANPEMERGGCVIETQQGTIDARLETQLERITAELLNQNLG